MSHNFKPGNLALIVNAKKTENIGRVVELVRFTDEEIIRSPDGGVFGNPDRLACWVVSGEALKNTRARDGWVSFDSYGAVEEKNLIPLQGDHFIPLTKREEVKA